MGINLASSNTNTQQTNVTPKQEEQFDVVPFDIQAEKLELTNKLVNSAEVDAIASTLDVTDMNTMVTFGAEVAENISKASDVILNSMNMDQINKSSKMLEALNDIMGRFDIDEIKEADKSFFGKLFYNAKKHLDKILSKYHTMGDEVDKIYIELKKIF